MHDRDEFLVSGLYVYPLKSAGGIELTRAELDSFGVRHDRRWMVVDGNGRFLTQREVPALALVRTAFDAGMLRLSSDRAGSLRLPLQGSDGERRQVVVWNDATVGVDAGDEAAEWISAAIGRPARILHMPDDVVRPVDPAYAMGDERVSFADGFPLLLITQASLDGLNARLEQPLPMNRFRPNLVVRGTAPHAEDEWRRFRIADTDFSVVKPCARCVTTTVDQDTGFAGREPLRTLATYRKAGSKVLFGQNVIHGAPGTIAIDDRLVVLDASPDPARVTT